MNLINLNANLIFYIYSPTIIHYLTINLTYYLTPPIAIGYKSCCGNFSQPI